MGNDPLDDWDATLKGSSLSRCNDSTNLMNFVKAFFLTSGFLTPRSIVNLNSELTEMLLHGATTQDPSNPKIFSPRTMREQVGISEAILIAKQLQEAEWQVEAAADTVTNRGRDDALGVLENSTLNALSRFGVSPNATKVIQVSNADKVKPKDIATLNHNAKTGDIAKLPYNLILSADIYTLLMMDTKVAKKDGKQRITYFYLCDNEFLPPWMRPEAV